jgi:hypothetical protein
MKPKGPFTGKPVAIMVEIKGHSLGFLPLQDKRESASAWIVTEVGGSYNDITYANGGFVAVGQSGMILTSADGKDWADRSAGLKEALTRNVRKVEDVACKAVAYGSGAFVVLCHYDPGSGTRTLILGSPDGNQWSRHWREDHQLNSVAYGNGMFVAVGWYNRILTSPNGKEWRLNEAVIDEYWKVKDHDHFNGVTYGNGLFVAVGGTGYPVVGLVRTSVDGKNWTRQTLSDGYFTDVTYGNGLFVAVGEAGLIVTSTDGRNWSRAISGTRERLTSVSYGDGLFVAGGEWGVILTSSDGKNWNKQTSGTRHNLRGVTYGNGLFVAVGDGVILTSRLGKVSDTSSREPAAAQKPTTTIKERLPVKVGEKVVFVVPVAELPSDLQERLKGKAAFVVVDEQGRILKDKDVIFKALVAHHVARTLLDGPEPGWDVSNAESWAKSFEGRAETLRRILVQQGIADLLTEAGNLGARWLVIGGLAGATVPISAPRATIKAAVDQFLLNPKNVVRALLSADLAVAVKQMKKAAALLRSIQGYPLDSDVALKLLEVDALDAPLGSEAALARLKIAGEVPEQLLEPFIKALREGERLLRETAEPKVAFVGEWVSVTDKLVGLLRQVEGWNAYENERRKIIDNWINLPRGYLEMAEAIYSVAETAAETDSPSGKSESSEQRTPQGDFQAKLLWQRKFEDFPIWDVAISPDGRFLAVAGGSEYLIDKEGGVRLVRATDGALLKFLSLGKGNYASRVAFSPDGTLLAVEKGHHEVSFWRVGSGSLVGKKGSKKDLESFLGIGRSNVSPDGKLVAEVEDVVIEDAPDCGGLVKVQQKMVVRWVKDGRVAWDFATKFQCESPDAPPSPRSAAVFSPDGRLLAMAGRDGVIRIWSVKDRKLVGTLKMPAVYSLAFSNDGKLLAAGALTVPGEVRLWRVEEK